LFSLAPLGAAVAQFKVPRSKAARNAAAGHFRRFICSEPSTCRCQGVRIPIVSGLKLSDFESKPDLRSDIQSHSAASVSSKIASALSCNRYGGRAPRPGEAAKTVSGQNRARQAFERGAARVHE